MKTYVYETTTATAPGKLYRAITAISRWSEWDPEIAATSHDGALEPGARFTLKPKGGPVVKLAIVEAKEPSRFVDVAFLPLARMRTSHAFTPTSEGTRIAITIEIAGVLGFLWDRIVARGQAAGAEEQTRRLIAFAQALP